MVSKVLSLCLPSVSYSVVNEQRGDMRHGGDDVDDHCRPVGSANINMPAARATDSLDSGGDSGARTRSLRLAKPALSQLSYIPDRRPARPDVDGGPGWTRTTHLTLIRRAL
jgi:hypothetical protein